MTLSTLPPKPIEMVTLPGPQNQKRAVAFVRTPQAQQPRVLFTGESQSLLAGARGKALALGGMLTALLTPATVQAQQPAAPPQPNPGVFRFDSGAGPVMVHVGPVNRAQDAPELNQQMQSPLAVLSQNSLLSAQTQKELHQLLVDFEKQGVGQLAVAEISDTHQGDLNELATDIFNQIKLGEEGKNNGVLLLINNRGVRQGTRGKQMFIKPGHGLQNDLNAQMATQLLVNHAVPHLRNKDYDSAVKETVGAIQNLMTRVAKGENVNPNNMNNNWNNPPANNGGIGIDAETAVIIGVIALLVILAIVAAANGGCDSGGGWPSGSGGTGGGNWGGGWSSGRSRSRSRGSSGSSGSTGSSGGSWGGGGGGFSSGGGGGI